MVSKFIGLAKKDFCGKDALLLANMLEGGKESVKSARSSKDALSRRIHQAISLLTLAHPSLAEKISKMMPKDDIGIYS